MAVSDAIYGAARRYVSRERLNAILDHDYNQVVDELGATRSDRDAFFAFAGTIGTQGSSRSSGGYGWLGIRFQEQRHAEPPQIICPR